MKIRKTFPLLLLVVLISTGYFVPIINAGPYRDYDAFMTAFLSLAKDYPELVTYEAVGETVENRDIIMFKIGNPAGGRVLFDGAMHGEESIGGELLYFYAEWLLTSDDPLANSILARAYTLLIPALNVDEYNNARKNANGVDLNRNFATNWESGVSDPDSENYRGPAPLSEPESQTTINVFQTYSPHFYVNLHMWAGPYYAGSHYGDRTYYSLLVDKIDSLSRERGVTPYPYYGEFGGAGMAISDAARAGVTSFLIELTERIVSLSEIETVILPTFIPIATVLTQECALFPHFQPWDLKQDGKVSVTDVVIVALAFGSTPESTKWNPLADLNADRIIDVLDLKVVSMHFGEEYT